MGKGFLAILLLAGVGAAHAERHAGVRETVKAALREDRPASGVLMGREARPFQIVSRSDQPVALTAHAVERYENGCGRVRMTFVQPGALTRKGTREALRMDMEMNVCPDGSPYLPPERQDTTRSVGTH
jgi:hypothetical protein